MAIWKATEWEVCGKWHCGDCSDLAHGSNYWWHAPRLLGMPLDEYVTMLVQTFHAIVTYNAEKDVLCMSWNSQAEMRKYKNWINKKAREAKYQI